MVIILNVGSINVDPIFLWRGDLAKNGVQIPFYDIIEMKEILLNK